MPDRYRVRKDAPTIAHASVGAASDTGHALHDVTFEVLERKRLEQDKSGLLVLKIGNADAAFVNALRRIMIAEVETLAVDMVGIKENTSIIADEVLAHRIGLVPFNCDPEEFGDDEVLMFDIFKECQADGSNDTVYSSDLLLQEDESASGQSAEDRFPRASKVPAPLHDDIVLAKLIPGQSIFLRARLKRGVGKDHAKWSPVATASYRLMPIISIDNAVVQEQGVAQSIKAACPLGVFDIEDGDKLVAARPLSCTMCRECIRDPSFEGAVVLERDMHTFIFSIESVGMIEPEEIFRRACKVLREKARAITEELDVIIENEVKLK